jgi:hypothetical protein
MLMVAPRLDVPIETFPLGILYRLAVVPSIDVDTLDDLIPKPLAKIVRVHGVKLPATIAVVPLEPCMARVAAFGFDVKRGQSVSAIGHGQGDARDRDQAAVFLDGQPSTSDMCMPDGSNRQREFRR